MAGLFRRATTITMNKTVIQYRNKTISHYHDHAHDHVHLHGPGDWASLLIALIVMVGLIIAVIAVACLVSAKSVTSLGAEKFKKKRGLSRRATLAYKPVHLIFRWFKFTLKPPYRITRDKLQLAIWDTSF